VRANDEVKKQQVENRSENRPLIYQSQGDTILYLNKMKIDNKKIVKVIKRNLKDMKDVYNLSAPKDTFLLSLYTINNNLYFTIIAKNRKKISKYEITEKDIHGYTIIKNNYFIICGENNNQIKKVKDDHFSLLLSDILPVIDGFPPCWSFMVDNDRIWLIERYIPKGNNYHIKFP
jgi:CO dehydrogenase/acetyl-CoA synthase gamma subunit (corrinoid Fe-S protein)